MTFAIVELPALSDATNWSILTGFEESTDISFVNFPLESVVIPIAGELGPYQALLVTCVTFIPEFSISFASLSKTLPDKVTVFWPGANSTNGRSPLGSAFV